VGVDISSVAVMKARRRLPDLMAVVADLNAFSIPDQSFDAILNFYFLQRDLWQLYKRALRPGGVLFLETLTQEMLNIQPDMDPLTCWLQMNYVRRLQTGKFWPTGKGGKHPGVVTCTR